MKRKPAWGFFWFWAVLYTLLDLGASYFMGGHVGGRQLVVAIEGALLAAGMTWLVALWKWHKSEGF